MPTIGYVLSHEQFPVPALVDCAVAAERAGFDAVWTSDHFHPWQDNEGHAGYAWVTLAAVGQRTQRVQYGTAVTCPTYRYRPAEVAEAFASLSLLNPGRVFLGVGTGEALNEVPAGGGWGGYQERADRLAEAVAIIRKLWTGEWISHRGRYYTIENARLYDTPPRPVPIYMAAEGPKSMKRAGQYGDGLITDAKRALMPEMRQPFAEGCREAGKDPAQMPILAELFVCTGDKDEAERAARLWRFTPRAWDEYVNDPDPRDIQRRAEQEVPLEEAYKDWPIGNDPDVQVQAIKKLIDGGVTHVFVHSAQQDQAAVIDFYGKQVLPKLR